VSPAEAAQFGWDAVLPLVKLVMAMAVFLLGFALLREISR
jgi:hypothetical protein